MGSQGEYAGSKILVTGATGFVGKQLVADLIRAGATVVTLARAQADINVDLAAKPPLVETLRGCTAVIHLASRVHVMEETDANPLAAYRRLNVGATEHLAQEALAAGVPAFVFLSSIKVNGERTIRIPFTETDLPAPEDAYGRSKLEAEIVLRKMASSRPDWQLLVLRPPLVYGPGVKANFAQLVNLVRRMPMLPFGAFHRKRSLVFVRNLTSAIMSGLQKGARGTFVVSDGAPVSVCVLTFRIAIALKKTVWIFPVPVFLLKSLAALVGRSAQISRLTDALVVDGSGFEKAAEWKPPFTLEEGLAATVAAGQRE